eukprot:COSAG01_NODE_5472_length_4238_cov_5.639613_3_plen_36_part_00
MLAREIWWGTMGLCLGHNHHTPTFPTLLTTRAWLQ